MSRAYRVRVQESLVRNIDVSDEVCADLEILELLPCDQMDDLLTRELQARGYEEKDGKLVKSKDGLTVTVDPAGRQVTVRTEAGEQVKLKVERETMADTDYGESESKVKKKLRTEAQKDLEGQVSKRQEKLQGEVSQRLEQAAAGVRQEINDAVNAVTREAMKLKAAAMGQIKEVSEDPAAGSLTIKVEV